MKRARYQKVLDGRKQAVPKERPSFFFESGLHEKLDLLITDWKVTTSLIASAGAADLGLET